MIAKLMPKSKRSARRKPRSSRVSTTPKRRRRSNMYKSSKAGTCVIKDGSITWTLPRRVKSLNVLCSRLSRYGDTQAWEKEIARATITSSDDSLGPCSKQRLRLSITRLAPSKAFFLDRTNLAGGVKGLEDTLVRLEYLVDDCEEWEDGPHVSQGVSDDGKYWTVVTLSEIRA